MSNAMSRSKSRWKGALLATVAGAVVSPLAAKASMQVGVYLNPIGQTPVVVGGVTTNPQTNEYLTPASVGVGIPLYVYATVTGTGNVTPVSGSTGAVAGISTGTFNGLQYLYYNLMATGGNAAGISGAISAPTLNATLGFDSTEGSPGDGGSGNQSGGSAAQAGTPQNAALSTLGAGAEVVAVGSPAAWAGTVAATSPVSSSAMTDFAKPRAGNAVWSNYQTYSGGTYTYANDGTNIIIGTGSNGLATNQVAFLVEKFTYTPASFNVSSVGNLVGANFGIQAPVNSSGGSLLNGSQYVQANSFNDSGTSVYVYNSSTGSPLAALTSSNYSIGHTVTLTDTMNGDANGDGSVGFADLGIVLGHYGLTDTNWSDGNFLYSTTPADTTVGFGDLGLVLGSYGLHIGSAPADIAADSQLLADPQAVALLESYGITPVSAVPEPASLGVLGLLAAAGLGRRRRS